MTLDYDVAVIGAGPAGEKAATKAAYLGKRVALIERPSDSVAHATVGARDRN